jgi:plasmid stabilization system protein ParE
MANEFTVTYSKTARESLRFINAYLSERASVAVATKVRKELLRTAANLRHNPRICPRHQLAVPSGFEIRACVKWSYKVLYEISGNRVRVVDFFHTSRDPSRINEVEED